MTIQIMIRASRMLARKTLVMTTPVVLGTRAIPRAGLLPYPSLPYSKQFSQTNNRRQVYNKSLDEQPSVTVPSNEDEICNSHRLGYQPTFD